jgi:hypothetical protein
MHAPTSDHSRARLQGPSSYSSATPDRLKESAGHHQAIHLYPQSKRHPLDLAGSRSSSEAYCKAQPRPGEFEGVEQKCDPRPPLSRTVTGALLCPFKCKSVSFRFLHVSTTVSVKALV